MDANLVSFSSDNLDTLGHTDIGLARCQFEAANLFAEAVVVGAIGELQQARSTPFNVSNNNDNFNDLEETQMNPFEETQVSATSDTFALAGSYLILDTGIGIATDCPADSKASSFHNVTHQSSQYTFESMCSSKKSMPSSEEMLAYASAHNLQRFFSETVRFLAQHMPDDPLVFLVDHIQDVVAHYRRTFEAQSCSDEGCVSRSLAPRGSISKAQQASVARQVTASLRSPPITRLTATKVFQRFASGGGGERMHRQDFANVLIHWGQSWGLPLEDSDQLVDVLKRWRFRQNAASGRIGHPLWPMLLEDFIAAYHSLMIHIRDRFTTLGGIVDRSQFIRQANGMLADKYELGQILGHGAYGEVALVTLRSTGVRRVCKRVRRDQRALSCEEFVDEVNVLRSLDHPHIIRLFEYFESNDYIEMIMEPVFGGNLGQLVRALYESTGTRPPTLTEAWVASVSAQLLGALSYAHEVVGVIHKDLKSENVLLVGNPDSLPEATLQQPAHAMLADFGIAQVFTPDPMLGGVPSAKVGGTPAYMSPEMFKGSFTEKCDVWGLGVVLFHIMTGVLPYRSKNLFSLAYKVCNPREHPPWELLSENKWSLGARQFCQSLLLKDPGMRCSASAALTHEWLNKLRRIDESLEEVPLALRDGLQTEHLQSHLLKMARHCLTSQLSLGPLHQLNNLFRMYDRDGNGRLSHLEMRQVLDDIGILNSEDIDLIIESLDTDRSGMIEYSEFIAGCIDLASDEVRKHLRAVFDIFDLDGNGSISAEELNQVLTIGANPVTSPAQRTLAQRAVSLGAWGNSLSQKEFTILPDGMTADEVLAALDANNTGQIEYDEFERYLLTEHARTRACRTTYKE